MSRQQGEGPKPLGPPDLRGENKSLHDFFGLGEPNLPTWLGGEGHQLLGDPVSSPESPSSHCTGVETTSPPCEAHSWEVLAPNGST